MNYFEEVESWLGENRTINSFEKNLKDTKYSDSLKDEILAAYHELDDENVGEKEIFDAVDELLKVMPEHKITTLDIKKQATSNKSPTNERYIQEENMNYFEEALGWVEPITEGKQVTIQFKRNGKIISTKQYNSQDVQQFYKMMKNKDPIFFKGEQLPDGVFSPDKISKIEDTKDGGKIIHIGKSSSRARVIKSLNESLQSSNYSKENFNKAKDTFDAAWIDLEDQMNNADFYKDPKNEALKLLKEAVKKLNEIKGSYKDEE